MGYIGKAVLIKNGSTKVSNSLNVIESYDFAGLWSGASFNKQFENLDKVKKNLEMEIQKCVSFASSLEILQKYKDNKNEIDDLYSKLSSLPSDEEYDNERKSYNSKIAVLENSNNQLRDMLLANMAEFSSSKIGSEITLNSSEGATTKAFINDIPLIFQNDYKDVKYGGHGHTVADNGCGITCDAMLATYYTDTEVTPRFIAENLTDSKNSNLTNMLNTLDYYDIKWENVKYYPDNIKEKVSQGYTVILEMGEGSGFTEGRHFILITGITEDGKFLINDPNQNNYNKGALKNGFENGFEIGYTGLHGVWLIEPKSEYQERQAAKQKAAKQTE